jgi:GH15 family glucan-1,4-alpha-glucosidase
MPAPEYLPISDYGAIGNLRTVALVGRNGSVDWCSFPELAHPSVFGALLDRRKGGRFRVAPIGAGPGEQRYRGDTCVLETRWKAAGGRLCAIDFMPLRGTIVGAGDPDTAPEIHRLLFCEDGEVEVEVEWSPRFDYARAHARMERRGDRFLARAGRERIGLGGLPSGGEVVETEHGPELRARFTLRAGERLALVTRYAAEGVAHAAGSAEEPRFDLRESERLLRETCEVWDSWAHDNERRPTSDWAGEWHPLVTRSELTLKLLTHPDTGAIAAAPTTSLPETLGGVRNWDYRYCWVRDAVFTLQALYSLGHRAEAHDFLYFLHRAVSRGEQERWGLQIMYGLHGEADLPERELDHLEGYRGSRPVRIGNAAAGQQQHDTYGELLDGAYELVRRGEELEPEIWRLLSHVTERACKAWRERDHGIWEMRGSPRHFTYSKVMVWAALDRGVFLAEHYGMPGNPREWRRTGDALHRLILRYGYDREVGAFTQTFRSKALDATALLIPIQEFLPPQDPRVQSTIDRVIERLTTEGLVYRYRVDDGLPGEEGAFGLCTFWLVSALAISGRVAEAREIFTGMLERANPVGLYPEQIDPRTGAYLGNYPQAFTHLGLINAALFLAYAEGRPVPDGERLGEIVGTRRPGAPAASEAGRE